MSKRNPLTRRGYEKPQGCLVPLIGIVVCVGAFVNLIITEQGEDAFFDKAKPIELGMSEREVISIMGPPNDSDTVGISWGSRAAHDAPRKLPRMVDVPEHLRGEQVTRHLTWNYSRHVSLSVYLVDDHVLSTATVRPHVH